MLSGHISVTCSVCSTDVCLSDLYFASFSIELLWEVAEIHVKGQVNYIDSGPPLTELMFLSGLLVLALVNSC